MDIEDDKKRKPGEATERRAIQEIGVMEENMRILKAKIVEESHVYTMLNSMQHENSSLRNLIESQETEMRQLRSRIQIVTEMLSDANKSLRERERECTTLKGQALAEEQYVKQLLAEVRMLKGKRGSAENSPLSVGKRSEIERIVDSQADEMHMAREHTPKQVETSNEHQDSSEHVEEMEKMEKIVSNRLKIDGLRHSVHTESAPAAYTGVGLQNGRGSDDLNTGAEIEGTGDVYGSPPTLQKKSKESVTKFTSRCMRMAIEWERPELVLQAKKYLHEPTMAGVIFNSVKAILQNPPVNKDKTTATMAHCALLLVSSDGKGAEKGVTKAKEPLHEILDQILNNIRDDFFSQGSYTTDFFLDELHLYTQLAKAVGKTAHVAALVFDLVFYAHKMAPESVNSVEKWYPDALSQTALQSTIDLIVSSDKCVCCNRVHIDGLLGALQDDSADKGALKAELLLCLRLIGARSNFKHLRNLVLSSLKVEFETLALNARRGAGKAAGQLHWFLPAMAEMIYGWVVYGYGRDPKRVVDVNSFLKDARNLLAESLAQECLQHTQERHLVKHYLLHSLILLSMGVASQILLFMSEEDVKASLVHEGCPLCAGNIISSKMKRSIGGGLGFRALDAHSGHNGLEYIHRIIFSDELGVKWF